MSEKTKGFFKAFWCKFRDAVYAAVITKEATKVVNKIEE